VRCAPNWALAAGLASFIFPATARPQIAFTNLAETRIGRDPDDARILPSDLVPSASRASLFDQFSLDWTRGPLRLGFRFEMYTASDTLTAHYEEFRNKFASWTAEHYEFTCSGDSGAAGSRAPPARATRFAASRAFPRAS